MPESRRRKAPTPSPDGERGPYLGLVKHVMYSEGFAPFFNSGSHTDLTIRCDGREWKAHKIILSSHSEFFSKACDGRFKEGNENLVDLPEDDPDVVEAMLRFMYTGTYSVGDPSDEPRPSFSVRVFAIAEKYLVTQLKTYALRDFKTTASKAWRVDDFADAIALAYTSTTDSDGGLRDIITQIVTKHAAKLYKDHLKPTGDRAYDRFLVVSATFPQITTRVNAVLLPRSLPVVRAYCCPHEDPGDCQDSRGLSAPFYAKMVEGMSYTWRRHQCGRNTTLSKAKWQDYLIGENDGCDGLFEEDEETGL